MLIDLKGGEPVDQVFLAYLDTHRQHFAARHLPRQQGRLSRGRHAPRRGQAHRSRATHHRPPGVHARLRGPRHRRLSARCATCSTASASEGGDFYAALCAEFRDWTANTTAISSSPTSPKSSTVDGDVLADFMRTLYPPDGPWDFAAIGDDILGIVYERFLGNIVTVKHGAGRRSRKSRKSATPAASTTRRASSSIRSSAASSGRRSQGKTPAEVLDVKILDPACGSGSFLVAALQYLFDYCLAAVYADPSLAKAVVPASPQGRRQETQEEVGIAFQDKEGRWHLAPDFNAALLTHCIHGVDIDQQAVEVTVMSLYLKMLEGQAARELGARSGSSTNCCRRWTTTSSAATR